MATVFLRPGEMEDRDRQLGMCPKALEDACEIRKSTLEKNLNARHLQWWVSTCAERSDSIVAQTDFLSSIVLKSASVSQDCITAASHGGWRMAPSPRPSHASPRKVLQPAWRTPPRPSRRSSGVSGRPPGLRWWARRRSWPTPPSERRSRGSWKTEHVYVHVNQIEGVRLPRLWADCCRTFLL